MSSKAEVLFPAPEIGSDTPLAMVSFFFTDSQQQMYSHASAILTPGSGIIFLGRHLYTKHEEEAYFTAMRMHRHRSHATYAGFRIHGNALIGEVNKKIYDLKLTNDDVTRVSFCLKSKHSDSHTHYTLFASSNSINVQHFYQTHVGKHN